MATKDLVDKLMSTVPLIELDAASNGRGFAHVERDILLERANQNAPAIWSVSWGSASPGAWMFYSAQIANFGSTILTQANVTTFFGLGAFGSNAEDAFALRDTNWPVLNSEMFAVPPGEVRLIPSGHRVDHPIRRGHYMLNFLLWEQNHYHRPARILDRMHVRFEMQGSG